MVWSEAYYFMTLTTRGKWPRDLADQKKILIIRGRSSEDPVGYGQNIPRIGQPRSNYLHTLLIWGGSFKIQILWQSTLRSYHNMVGSKFLLWKLLQKVIPIKANHLKISLIRGKSLQSSFKYCGRSLQGSNKRSHSKSRSAKGESLQGQSRASHLKIMVNPILQGSVNLW